jgi:large subunit ribosomal protein L13
VYRSHSGYPGGFKEVKIEKLLVEQPERVVLFAVKGMLPDNRLKAKRLSRLFIYKDEEHPYRERIKSS